MSFEYIIDILDNDNVDDNAYIVDILDVDKEEEDDDDDYIEIVIHRLYDIKCVDLICTFV